MSYLAHKVCKRCGMFYTPDAGVGTGMFIASQYCSRDCMGYELHGKSGTPEYNAWRNMIARCYDKEHKDYEGYGARGIEVCQSWKASFPRFYADMGERPDGHSIERIDNNGNYTPNNCKWATSQEQANNKRNTKFITYQGETKRLIEWCSELSLNYGFVVNRLRLGWSVKDTFEKPKQRTRKTNTSPAREAALCDAQKSQS